MDDRKIHVRHHGGLGLLWFIGWLFSIGYVGLGFWKGLLALFVWPYFLGAHLADIPAPQTPPPAIIDTTAPTP